MGEKEAILLNPYLSLLIVIGVIFLFIGFFSKKKKDKIAGVILGILTVIYGMHQTSTAIIALNNPIICIEKGIFLGIGNKRMDPQQYVFEIGEEKKLSCFLDAPSANDIILEKFPDGLEYDHLYEIYYEKRTKVIVKIEELERKYKVDE